MTQRLLDEAYQHYFTHSNRISKSAEGVISLTTNNHFDRAMPPVIRSGCGTEEALHQKKEHTTMHSTPEADHHLRRHHAISTEAPVQAQRVEAGPL